MKKAKTLIVTGALFDLGVLMVAPAVAQTAPPATTTDAAADTAKPKGMTGSSRASGYFMKVDSAFYIKWVGDRDAGIKACAAKGGTASSKVNVQDLHLRSTAAAAATDDSSVYCDLSKAPAK